jgi:sporulation protein YlmC with PRC-barrel domain
MSGTTLKKHIFRSIIITTLIFLLPLFSLAEENSNLIPASKWIDHEIYGKTGKQIGEIDDLVIKRSGKIKKVTIDVGGFLGIGEKLVAVSPNELENLMVKGTGRMVLDTTEQQMEKWPEFDYYRRGLRPDYYYRSRYDRIYGYNSFPPPYPLDNPYGPRFAERHPAPYPEGKFFDWAFSPARFLATTLIGRRVIYENGTYIGRVADLLIDTRSVKIKKIILAAEDIRDDDARVAIPYEPPGFTAYGIVCDISRETIRNLPAYRNVN